MTVYQDRINDAAEDGISLADRLIDAARANGFSTTTDWDDIREALSFVSVQCDFENDDYETWEAAFLARLDDADKTGER